MSWLRPWVNAWMRRVEKPAMARAPDPAALRRTFERQARLLFHAPPGTRQQWRALDHAGGTLPLLEIDPPRLRSRGLLLYIHGGAFVFGSPRTHAAMLAQLARRCGARAVLPQYRLAPEAPYPAAAQDVMAAWQGLIGAGIPAGEIVIGGDSAGGALALGLLAQLCADGGPMPAGVFCLSPLTDMTHSGASFQTNAEAELVLPAQRADELGQLYLAGHPADDPKVSPLFADFPGAPPVWLTASRSEILRDDSRAMAEVLRRSGAPVTYAEREPLPHVWPILHNILPEARSTLEDLAAWITALPGWPDES